MGHSKHWFRFTASLSNHINGQQPGELNRPRIFVWLWTLCRQMHHTLTRTQCSGCSGNPKMSKNPNESLIRSKILRYTTEHLTQFQLLFGNFSLIWIKNSNFLFNFCFSFISVVIVVLALCHFNHLLSTLSLQNVTSGDCVVQLYKFASDNIWFDSIYFLSFFALFDFDG